MPSKPTWFKHLPQILASLEVRPSSAVPWIGCLELEHLLGISRRRAQQILRNCPHQRIGRNLVVSIDDLRRYFSGALAQSSTQQEVERRNRLAATIEHWREQRQLAPALLVSAPASIAQTRLNSLPSGVEIANQQLLVAFSTRQELLEKLLALACALAQDDTLADTPC